MSDDNLQEIQAKLAALEAKRKARATKDEIAVATAELARAELLDSLEEKYGRAGKDWAGIALSDDPEDPLVAVRRPAYANVRKFQDGKAGAADAAKALVKSCLVHPEFAEFEALVQDFPLLLERTALAALKLAGYRDDEKR